MTGKQKRSKKKIEQEIEDTMSSTDETKESLREYRSWPEHHREVFIKLLKKNEIFATRVDWNHRPDDPKGIWMGLAKMLNYEAGGTTAYTGQQCAYMTMALRARHSREVTCFLFIY